MWSPRIAVGTRLNMQPRRESAPARERRSQEHAALNSGLRLRGDGGDERLALVLTAAGWLRLGCTKASCGGRRGSDPAAARERVGIVFPARFFFTLTFALTLITIVVETHL